MKDPEADIRRGAIPTIIPTGAIRLVVMSTEVWQVPETQSWAGFQVFYVLPTFGLDQYSLFPIPHPPSCLPLPGRKYPRFILLRSRWLRYGLADALPMAMRHLMAADRLTGLTAVMTHPFLSAGPGCMSGWGGLTSPGVNLLVTATKEKGEGVASWSSSMAGQGLIIESV